MSKYDKDFCLEYMITMDTVGNAFYTQLMTVESFQILDLIEQLSFKDI